MDDQDVNLQRILWKRENGDIDHYQLLTVTYGVSSAPYLAIRTLHQLASDEGNKYSLAKRALMLDTYVNDIVTGAEALQSAIHLKNQLSQLLLSGGFPLRKWVSNEPALLEEIPLDERLRPLWKDFMDHAPVQALEISWDPVQDELRFTTPVLSVNPPATKQEILFIIARPFDPLGWLSPSTIRAKISMEHGTTSMEERTGVG